MISLSRLKEMVEEEMENKIKDLELALKAKEQQCETLASQLDFEVQKKECLEQECEELKIYIESNEQQVKYVETLVMDNDRLINELDQLKAENEELKKNYFTVIQQRNKAEKTLTEIKEIAENVKGYDPLAKQILQKISECEVGR